MQKAALILISLLSSFAIQAQNSFSFSLAAQSNPDNLVDNEAYLNMAGNETTVEYSNPPIPQFSFGYSLHKPNKNWSWDFGLSYRYIEVHPTVHHDTNGYYGFALKAWDEDYIASLNYLGISAGTSYSFPFKNGNSKLSIPIGAQLLLPFSCKTLRQLSEDTYIFQRIFQGEDYSKGIYYGLYLRPTYSFKLSKKQDSPWVFGVFAEAELLFLNQPNRDPSFLAGGGVEIRYQL